DRFHQDIQDGKRPCRDHQKCPACLDTEHTLVVAMWRNPYDWISGMKFNPHHAKAHRGVQDLSEFMTMPWIMQPENEERARKDALMKAKEEAKILDFNAVETWVPFYEKIAYEDMLVGERLRDWLRSLETKYGLVGNYIDVPDSALEESMALSRSRMYYTNSQRVDARCTHNGRASRSKPGTSTPG
ncbi:unnamed protein product, partial [Ectocarpus sp. 4 AP-2014]